MLKLIQSYMQDRTQVVNIKGSESKAVVATSRVPQGSILGPILFTLFINDLFLVIRICKILDFADDTKLFHRIKSIEYAMNLQLDLQAALD